MPQTLATTTAMRHGFADDRRGSRHARGYGSAWDKLRVRILERDAGLCQPCAGMDRLTVGNIVDHIVPKAQGGTDDPGNLQTICRDCHSAKTALEALAARGIVPALVRPRPACTSAGLPTDPRHPWSQGQGGVQNSAPFAPGTDPLSSLAKPRNG